MGGGRGAGDQPMRNIAVCNMRGWGVEKGATEGLAGPERAGSSCIISRGTNYNLLESIIITEDGRTHVKTVSALVLSTQLDFNLFISPKPSRRSGTAAAAPLPRPMRHAGSISCRCRPLPPGS